MRKHPVLPSGHKNDGKLKTLRGVQRHQRHDPGRVLRDVVTVSHQRDAFEECGESAGCRAIPLVAVDSGFGPQCLGIGLIGSEFMCDAHQFVEVVQPGQILRIGRGLKLPTVTGAFEHLLDELAKVGIEVAAQLVEQVDEPRYRLLSAGVQQRHSTFGCSAKRIGEAASGRLRVHGHTGLGPVADAPARRVENASEAHRIAGIIEDPQVGDDVANFLALVKANSPNDFVGNSGANEYFLEGPRRVVGAIKDGDVVVGDLAARSKGIDLIGNETRFVVLVIGNVTNDQLAITGIGP